jgi:hypothetical protein
MDRKRPSSKALRSYLRDRGQVMIFQKTSGMIENLYIGEDKKNIIFAPGVQEGLDGMSEFYLFDLNGAAYAFSIYQKAKFKNGDSVELVFKVKPRGNEVVAMRRPSTRSIWISHLLCRGTHAIKWASFHAWWKWSVGCGLVMILFIGITELVSSEFKFDFRWAFIFISVAFILSFLLVGIFLLSQIRSSLDLAREGEEIFKILGYPEPEKIDLFKTTKAYRKAHPEVDIGTYDGFDLWY